MILLEHMFASFGLDPAAPGARVGVVRHLDRTLNVSDIYRRGQLELYQSFQSKPAFRNYQTLLTFVGQPNLEAVYVGAYSVGAESAPGEKTPPSQYLEWSGGETDLFHYELTRDPAYDALKDRLVIKWQGGGINWVQAFRANTIPVVEVLPDGYVREFPGFLDFTLTLGELRRIVQNAASHRNWHLMLSSVAGVYLILNEGSGEQYVGSAYGAKGILGRWRTYAENGHGGNAQLCALAEANPDAPNKFRFSILQTLPRTLTSAEVIAYERRHKEKLGTRAHGLNGN